jgi:hypothetical protein
MLEVSEEAWAILEALRSKNALFTSLFEWCPGGRAQRLGK